MKKIICLSTICLLFFLVNTRVNAQCSNTGYYAMCQSYSVTSTADNWAYWYVAPYTTFSVSVYLESYGSTGYAHADIYTDGGTAGWDAYVNNTPISDHGYVQGGDYGYFELVTYVNQGSATITAYW